MSEARGNGKVTPVLKTALSSASIPVGSSATDTATVFGTKRFGSPAGSVTFDACGPTAGPAPCTSPNLGGVTVTVTPGAHHRSSATVTIEPGAAGWYCFLDLYNGDTHYNAVSDNDTKTECLDATTSTGSITPTLTTALSPSTIDDNSTAVDTATVTGTSAAGSPTGSVTFTACGPTASPTPCTSPNVGPATVGLSAQSNNRSTASVIIDPDAPGWYCFLDQYNGDSHYKVVTDNDTHTECLDVTSSTGSVTPTFKTALSSSSIPFGSTAVDTATVTGTAAGGSPTGTVTFTACGPTASAAPCTSPNIGPATAGLSPQSNNRSTASVTINPGAPGWYCFLDQYSGDGYYTSATDNDTATECLDVTSSSAAPRRSSSTLTATPGATASATSLSPVR